LFIKQKSKNGGEQKSKARAFDTLCDFFDLSACSWALSAPLRRRNLGCIVAPSIFLRG
jgi:hypothetical protein